MNSPTVTGFTGVMWSRSVDEAVAAGGGADGVVGVAGVGVDDAVDIVGVEVGEAGPLICGTGACDSD